MKIAIVGAGSAGLFTAWYLARLGEGLEISVFDRLEPGHGTTWRAAGMLAPVNELEFQEIEILAAGLKSREMYYQEVGPLLGEIGLRHHGSLEVALSADDSAYLRRQFEHQMAHGLDVEWLQGAMAIQEVEPFVSHQVQHAIWSHSDTQVDPWALVLRLVHHLRALGVSIEGGSEVARWEQMDAGQARLLVQGEWRQFDRVVLALGIPSAAQAELLPYKIYPVHGEMVCLQAPEGDYPSTQVRIVSKVLGKGYVVPKMDRILCGATSEERGLETSNTAGGLLNILRRSYAAVPSIAEMRVQEIWSGLRPSTLNRLPVVGREEGTPFYHVNGLYRHGILLGPLVGKSMALELLGGAPLAETLPFRLPSPTRKLHP